MNYWSSQMLVMAAFGVAMAYGPVIALILTRKSLVRLNAAAGLVILGAIIVAVEHAGFATSFSQKIARVPGSARWTSPTGRFLAPQPPERVVCRLSAHLGT